MFDLHPLWRGNFVGGVKVFGIDIEDLESIVKEFGFEKISEFRQDGILSAHNVCVSFKFSAFRIDFFKFFRALPQQLSPKQAQSLGKSVAVLLLF